MEKKHAFFLALLVTLLIAGNWLFFNAPSLFSEREKVLIARVIDGDTVELEDGRTVRLLNINAEEKGRAWSEEATAFLKQFENKSVELDIAGIGKYGRILGRFYDDYYLNLRIVELGLAHKYLVEMGELKNFEDAEKIAIEEDLGIWKKSEYYGCLEVKINEKEEFVSIINNCGADTEGWTIKDESTKEFKISKIDKPEFVLYSGKGDGKEDELFWGAGNVWNNDRDSIFVRDKNGLLVFYDSYGY